MRELKILEIGNHVLRQKCEVVEITQEELEKMLGLGVYMVQLMLDAGGCGIAAPQVGVNKRMFIAIIDGKYISFFINPEIIAHSAETECDSEGCLSVPGLCGDVERFREVTMRYFNGKEIVEKTFSGLNARIIQRQ